MKLTKDKLKEKKIKFDEKALKRSFNRGWEAGARDERKKLETQVMKVIPKEREDRTAPDFGLDDESIAYNQALQEVKSNLKELFKKGL